MYKYCSECKKELCIDSFKIRTYRNRYYLNSRCILCDRKRRNEASKERYKEKRDHILNLSKETRLKNKQFWIEKLGGKCKDCGNTFPSIVYDFHHLNPSEKEYSPGQLLDRSTDLIERELSKCILLCSNCHRLRHHLGKESQKNG